MINKTKIALSLVILIFSGGNCLADTKVGIGTGVSPFLSGVYGGIISVPIKFGSHVLIEPYAGYYDTSNDPQDSQNYRVTEITSYQAGTGLYGISKLSKEFELYYGTALAVDRNKNKYEYKITNGTTTNFSHQEIESKTYLVKPTLGISYLINENFTVSLDAGIYYYWGKDKNTTTSYYTSTGVFTSSQTESTEDRNGISTFTALIFRMMF